MSRPICDVCKLDHQVIGTGPFTVSCKVYGERWAPMSKYACHHLEPINEDLAHPPLTADLSQFHTLAELVRIHRGGYGEIDVDAMRWLTEHEPPLVCFGPLSKPMVTDEGARLIAELLATWEEQV